MKKGFIKNILVAVLLLQAGILSAQNFQGKATYHSASKMNFSFSRGEANEQVSEEIKKQLSKQMQKEYTLLFNVKESTWQEAESLDGGKPATASAGGTSFVSISTGSNGILYKNTAEGKYEQEKSVFGKPFLVKDKLKPFEWQLTGESKKIGNYNCQQAVYERVTTRRAFRMVTGDVDEEEESVEEVQDTVKVTAWFTPEIPVSHGPEDYWGLPGLILEVNNGTTTLVCSQVVLNPEDGIELKMPAKGKVVSRDEYVKIQEAKAEEMMKKYRNGGGAIRIGSGGGQ